MRQSLRQARATRKLLPPSYPIMRDMSALVRKWAPLHWPVDRYFEQGPRDAVFLGEHMRKYHRTVRMDDATVTFLVKDYRNEGQWKELTISGVEFVRRFLMHVPPRRFV